MNQKIIFIIFHNRYGNVFKKELNIKSEFVKLIE